jgi:hypothetical protein
LRQDRWFSKAFLPASESAAGRARVEVVEAPPPSGRPRPKPVEGEYELD